jgi:hypothetical protein
MYDQTNKEIEHLKVPSRIIACQVMRGQSASSGHITSPRIMFATSVLGWGYPLTIVHYSRLVSLMVFGITNVVRTDH